MAKQLAGDEASRFIDTRILELADWRGETLAKVRALIHEADPEVVEEVKWMGTPVWSHDGGLCTGETYKAVVKLTFFKGAALSDPSKLFNSSLDGNVRRALDIRQDEKIDAKAFKALIREAVALNTGGTNKRSNPKASKAKPPATKEARPATKTSTTKARTTAKRAATVKRPATAKRAGR